MDTDIWAQRSEALCREVQRLVDGHCDSLDRYQRGIVAMDAISRVMAVELVLCSVVPELREPLDRMPCEMVQAMLTEMEQMMLNFPWLAAMAFGLTEVAARQRVAPDDEPR